MPTWSRSPFCGPGSGCSRRGRSCSRRGRGWVEAVTELFPEVAVGYVGLERDEASLLPQSYYRKMPPLAGRQVLVLDPMLATGGSGAAACAAVKEGDPAGVRFVCVVAAPEGVA